MIQIKFSFFNFVFNGVCLPQYGSMPAAYAVAAGGCDWPIQQWRHFVTSLTFVPYLTLVPCEVAVFDDCDAARRAATWSAKAGTTPSSSPTFARRWKFSCTPTRRYSTSTACWRPSCTWATLNTEVRHVRVSVCTSSIQRLYAGCFLGFLVWGVSSSGWGSAGFALAGVCLEFSQRCFTPNLPNTHSVWPVATVTYWNTKPYSVEITQHHLFFFCCDKTGKHNKICKKIQMISENDY